MGRRAIDPALRFKQFTAEVNSGCIVWTSTKNRQGYGRFFYQGKQAPAHRVSYELANGPIPEGELVLHKCDNPACVNPDHLYLGDYARNVRDAVERGRWTGRLRISARTVREIKERYAFGGISQARLAAEYGIDQTQVSKYVLLKQRAT